MHCKVGTDGEAFHPNLDPQPFDAIFLKGEHAAAYSGSRARTTTCPSPTGCAATGSSRSTSAAWPPTTAYAPPRSTPSRTASPRTCSPTSAPASPPTRRRRPSPRCVRRGLTLSRSERHLHAADRPVSSVAGVYMDQVPREECGRCPRNWWRWLAPEIARPSAPWSTRTGSSSRCTATGCSARCRMPRTCCRRRCWRRGWASTASRAGPRCAPGSTGSRPTGASTTSGRTSGDRRWRRPSGVPAPSSMSELTWLQPFPDLLLEGLPDDQPGPEARYESREAITLAFITAMQRLPPRQRAVLILRDVLGYPARETADLDRDVRRCGQQRGQARPGQARGARARRCRRPAVGGPLLAGREGAGGQVRRGLRRARRRRDGRDDVRGRVAPDAATAVRVPRPRSPPGSSSRPCPASGDSTPVLVATGPTPSRAWGDYRADPVTGLLHLTGIEVLTLSGGFVTEINRFEATDRSVVRAAENPRPLTHLLHPPHAPDRTAR